MEYEENSVLKFAQVGWVVPDINEAIAFFSETLGITGFPLPQRIRALDLNMSYYGQAIAGEWLTSQVYNGACFIELVQPLGGQSMFHDYLDKYPLGGIQHNAFRLPVRGYAKVIQDMKRKGFEIISEVDHPIARMTFFDTYPTLGVATEIMGITDEGWAAIEEMEHTG